MAQGLPIDINTFRDLKSPKAKLDALFDVLVFMHSAEYECKVDRNANRMICAERFKHLESRKNWDTTLSGATGMVGGALFWIAKWIIGK